MEITFKILAVILAGVAAYFLWQENADGAFAAAVFGAVFFFLSVRFQVKSRLDERESERLEAESRREAAELEGEFEDELEGEFEEGNLEDEETSRREPPLLTDAPARGQFESRPQTTGKEQI